MDFGTEQIMETTNPVFDKTKIYMYFGRFGKVFKLIKIDGNFFFVDMDNSKVIPTTDDFSLIIEDCKKHGELVEFENYETMILLLNNRLKN